MKKKKLVPDKTMQFVRFEGETFVFTQVPFKGDFDTNKEVIEKNILQKYGIRVLFEMDIEENIKATLFGDMGYDGDRIMEIISKETNKFLK